MVTRHLSRAFEVREVKGTGRFTGYASVFHEQDSYGDVVLPGAFAKSLGEWKTSGRKVPVLWQHQADEPLGIWTKLEEDGHGLHAEGQLVMEDPKAQAALAHIKAGTVTGLSIGFSIPKGGADHNPETGGSFLREVKLWETSLVTFPSNDLARIETVKTALEDPRGFERLLREQLGLSRSQAQRFMARGVGGLRDDDGDDVLEALRRRGEAIGGST